MNLVVLIVDDDDAVRFFHRAIVSQSKLSADPLSFKSGEDVFNYLDRHAKDDEAYLMLLDINMPLMNGWDLLELVAGKPYYKQLYVVMITSSVDKVDREKASLYSSVMNVVEKPISIEECKKIMKQPSIAGYF